MKKILENNPFKNSGIFLDEKFLKKFGIGGGVLLKKEKFNEELKKDEELKKFFSSNKKIFEKGDFVNLKGINQVLPGLDKSLTVQEKIDILEKELNDFIKFFEDFDQNNINQNNLDLYIGVFSSGKNALLTMFNALVSVEKLGEYNLKNPDYLKYKYILKSNLTFLLESYYNLILEGNLKNINKKDFDLKNNLKEILEYLVKNYFVESFSSLNEIQEQRLLKKYFKQKLEEAKLKNDQISEIKYLVKLDLIEREITKKDLEKDGNITSFKGTFLSNFYEVSINYNGKKFPSTEHTYFYYRFNFDDLKKKLKQENNLIFKIIKDDLEYSIKNEKFFENNEFEIEKIDTYFYNFEISPNFLKRLAQKLEIFGLTTKGYSREKLTKMIELSLEKYRNKDLQEKLLDTGDNLLIEGNDWGDKYWGIDLETGKGNNLLGRILMIIREKLK